MFPSQVHSCYPTGKSNDAMAYSERAHLKYLDSFLDRFHYLLIVPVMAPPEIPFTALSHRSQTSFLAFLPRDAIRPADSVLPFFLLNSSSCRYNSSNVSHPNNLCDFHCGLWSPDGRIASWGGQSFLASRCVHNHRFGECKRITQINVTRTMHRIKPCCQLFRWNCSNHFRNNSATHRCQNP